MTNNFEDIYVDIMSRKTIIISELASFIEAKNKMTDDLRVIFSEFCSRSTSKQSLTKGGIQKRRKPSAYNEYIKKHTTILKQQGNKPKDALCIARKMWNDQKNNTGIEDMFSNMIIG